MPRAKKPKPETEIILTQLQDRYMQNPNDKEVFQEYFLILKNYARSLTLKEIKTKVYLEPDHVDGVATEAVLKLLNQYRKDGWKVWGSFAGALRWKVVEALYEGAQEESSQSLNTVLGDGNSQELGDATVRLGMSLLWGNDVEDPQNKFFNKHNTTASEVFSVLKDAEGALPYRLLLLFHAYLLLRLRRPKARLTLPSFKEYFLNNKAEEAFELLLLEVRNRVSSHSVEN